MHHYNDLIRIFDDCFFSTYQTRLICGQDEPLYRPANETCPYHAIIFANQFFSSALHECAHWCVAGPERRLLVDSGYWYAPDGRTPQQQALFFDVEVKPQALEWLFSQAAGYRFVFSVDNLNDPLFDPRDFKQRVETQVKAYQQNGLPQRASIFYHALHRFYD